MKDRCITDEQKTEFCLQLLEIWKSSPELRFGQLLLDSIPYFAYQAPDYSEYTDNDKEWMLQERELDIALAQRERILYNIEDLALLRGLK